MTDGDGSPHPHPRHKTEKGPIDSVNHCYVRHLHEVVVIFFCFSFFAFLFLFFYKVFLCVALSVLELNL